MDQEKKEKKMSESLIPFEPTFFRVLLTKSPVLLLLLLLLPIIQSHTGKKRNTRPHRNDKWNPKKNKKQRIEEKTIEY